MSELQLCTWKLQITTGNIQIQREESDAVTCSVKKPQKLHLVKCEVVGTEDNDFYNKITNCRTHLQKSVLHCLEYPLNMA